MEGKILLCEGWVEKQVVFDQKLNNQSKRWKTRYALLMRKSSTNLGLQFYQKKPKAYTDITDECITLRPWRYTVDMLAEGKNRAHVIRIQVYDQGYVTPASAIIEMSMQFNEEALTWVRCIQNLTKLTSGIQGHTFSALTHTTPSSRSIGVSERHCVLHIAAEAVILALKNERSVAAVWPLSSIRNYSTSNPSHFTIESGRRSPLGEGVYVFQTMEGDGDKLFNLLDHYTGVASVSMIETSPNETMKHRSTANGSQPSQTRSSVRELPTRFLPSSPTPSKPPRKPPLPKGTILVSPKATERSIAGPSRTEPSTQQAGERKPDKNGKASSDESVVTSRGLYDLDKLLYTLEGSLRKTKPTSTSITERENIDEICEDLLVDLVEKVHNSKLTCSTVSEQSFVPKPNSANSSNSVTSLRGKKPEILTPKPKSKKLDPQYSSVDFRKKSFKKK